MFVEVFARSQIYLADPPLKADTRWAFTDNTPVGGEKSIKRKKVLKTTFAHPISGRKEKKVYI